MRGGAHSLLKTFRIQSRVTAEPSTSIAQFPNHGRKTCCPVSQGRLYSLSPFLSKIFRAPPASELLSPEPQRARRRSHLRFLPCANRYEFSNKSIRTKEIVFEFSQSEASLWPFDTFHNKKEVEGEEKKKNAPFFPPEQQQQKKLFKEDAGNVFHIWILIHETGYKLLASCSK